MLNILPLTLMPEGTEGRIIRINAGRGLARRLTEMGFTENAMVKILRSDRGCLIVTMGGCRYALSKGIAMKIMVADE